MSRIWYLSFSGDKWLGACYVRAEDGYAAIARVNELGINPGGEVLMLPAPEGAPEVEPTYMDRLLNQEEVGLALREGPGVRIGPELALEVAGKLGGDSVCEECNR